MQNAGILFFFFVVFLAHFFFFFFFFATSWPIFSFFPGIGKKKWARRIGLCSKSESTYVCGFVRQTFFFFLALAMIHWHHINSLYWVTPHFYCQNSEAVFSTARAAAPIPADKAHTATLTIRLDLLGPRGLAAAPPLFILSCLSTESGRWLKVVSSNLLWFDMLWLQAMKREKYVM